MVNGLEANFINGLQSRPTYASAGRVVPPDIPRHRGHGGRSAARRRPFRLDRRDLLAVAAEIMRQHEVGDARRDFGTETRAVENAVVADARLQPVSLEVAGQIAE